MDQKARRPSKILQIVAPIANISRKLSRKDRTQQDDKDDDIDSCYGTEDFDTSLNIPLEFVSQMKEAFHLFDKDKNGFICSREFGPLLRALGRNPTGAEVNSLMAEADVDHNGKLDLTEFILLMHKTIHLLMLKKKMRRRFGWLF